MLHCHLRKNSIICILQQWVFLVPNDNSFKMLFETVDKANTSTQRTNMQVLNDQPCLTPLPTEKTWRKTIITNTRFSSFVKSVTVIFMFKIVIIMIMTLGKSIYSLFSTLERVSPSLRSDTRELFCGISFMITLIIALPYIILKSSINSFFSTLQTFKVGFKLLLLQ